MGPHLGTKETSYILFPRQQLTDLIFPPPSPAPIINYPNQSFWREKLNKQVDHFLSSLGHLEKSRVPQDTYTTVFTIVAKLICIMVYDYKDHCNIFFFLNTYICVNVYVYKLKFHRYLEVFPIYWIELIQIVVILYICCWPLKKIQSVRRIIWFLFNIRIRTCA